MAICRFVVWVDSVNKRCDAIKRENRTSNTVNDNVQEWTIFCVMGKGSDGQRLFDHSVVSGERLR